MDKLQSFGLDWKVVPVPLQMVGNTETRPLPGYRAFVRSDNAAVLQVARKSYTPYQNAQGLELFRPFEEYGLDVSRGGSFNGGRLVFMQAELRGFEVRGDAMKTHLTYVNGHDGSAGTGFGDADTRIVCQNTCRMAYHELANKVRHTRNNAERLAAVRDVIAKRLAVLDERIVVYNDLADATMNAREFRAFLEAFVPQTAKAPPRAWRQLEVARTTEAGSSEAARGTRWGAFQAVTRWIDHERGRTPDSRMSRSWFGDGEGLRRKALALLSS